MVLIGNKSIIYFTKSIITYIIVSIFVIPVGILAQPSINIYGSMTAQSRRFEVYLSFSDSVTGLTSSDISVTNGSTDSILGAGKYYSAHIRAASPGKVIVKLPAGTVNEIHGSQLPNMASNNFVVDAQYDTSLVTWKVDSETDWKQAGSQSTGLDFSNGEARPTGNSGNYSSAIKVFSSKMRLKKIRFRQSPVWENWIEESEKVGPDGAGDAPIFLPVADGDYYFFGNDVGDYTAWHSTDMVNWDKYRAIASGPDLGSGHFRIGRWMTSAEYKDGKFYMIADVPNDEDPHLWIDDDLSDNNPAVYIDTAVFSDPSHGSDAALFRNDEDGLFHIIYEDWDPINARKHAWDSPLAGHTSSEDCINGFIPHKHLPVVDHRTTPTGKYSTFPHPGNQDPCSYENHEPEQDAFGDWSVLKVGSQMYLFSDYDPVSGGGMSVAIHTSSSIYKQFKLVGTVGSGHPDPTSGFAEGKFYLITQKADFTSPGPWVEEVETRAGVDTNGNGQIDDWTGWQAVKETYDHKHGYARVVDVTPAELDLSSLPKGYGFKFEFRVKDQTTNTSIPIIDYVEISFKPDSLVTGVQGHNHNPKVSPKSVFSIMGRTFRLRGNLRKVNIYDLSGKLVKEVPVLCNKAFWNGKNVKSGIFIARLISDNETRVVKIILHDRRFATP